MFSVEGNISASGPLLRGEVTEKPSTETSFWAGWLPEIEMLFAPVAPPESTWIPGIVVILLSGLVVEAR